MRLPLRNVPGDWDEEVHVVARTFVLSWIALAGCSGGKDEATDTGGTPATGETGDTGGTTPEGLAIAGTYTDEFGTEHVIDEVAWVQTYPGYGAWTFEIASYDNAAGWLVARNGDDNPYSAGLWSKFEWTRPDHLHYCQTAFGAASEAEAAATPAADPSDLETGCGGFPWTDLTP